MTSTEYTITELHTQIDASEPDFANIFAQASGGKVVGICRLDYGEGYAYIHSLYVMPEHRNAQLGTKLIERAVEICTALGIKTVGLSVKKENTEAQRLYARLGFVKFQQHDGYLQLVKMI
jgi:ribosomal protein S18 acetylase RimI-like enzyme